MVCLIPTISSLSSTQLLFPLGSNDNRKRVGKVIPGSYRSWKLGRYYCLALFVITSLILIDEANGSHIMTSESKEAEFEMIHTNNGDDSEERLKKKKTLVSEDDEMTKSDGSKVPKGHKRNGGTPPGPQPIGVPDVVITNKGSGGGINEEEGQVDSSNEGRDARNSIGTPLNEETIRELDEKTSRLRKIEELSTGLISEQCDAHEFEMMKGVKLSTEFANVIMEKVDMIVSFLYKLKKYESRIKNKKEVERDEQEVYKYVLETVKEAYVIKSLRLLIYNVQTPEQTVFNLGPDSTSSSSSASSLKSPGKSFLGLIRSPSFTNKNKRFVYLQDDSPSSDKAAKNNNNNLVLLKTRVKVSELEKQPWFLNPNAEFDHNKFMELSDRPVPKSSYHQNKMMDGGMSGGSHWTWPYFNCSNAKNQKVLDESQIIIRSPSGGGGGGGESANNNIPSNSQFMGDSSTSPDESLEETEDEQDDGKKSRESQKATTKVGHRRNSWLASYTAWFPIRTKERIIEEYGELSLDLDISTLEINPCGFSSEQEKDNDMITNPLYYFRDSHKCDRVKGTSVCHFIPGNPWRLGSYECKCKSNMYAYNKSLNNTIAGGIAEAAWMTMRENKTNGKDSIMYQDIVTCKECPDGCENCVDGVSCLAPSSLVFRIVLLSVSVICSFGSLALILVTYKFRKKPVLKQSSPLFHGITLCGCVIMYSEMIALFPVLTETTCIAVKWTRHLGFCVTYTALYMKLCRVFLTFRVKSAHKIKLTEKHLLHWMSPVMVVMLLYLFAWTISDPPSIEPMFTKDDLKFFQCVYNWWDHSLAIGEVIFLGYGVWICWRIRENPDAQFISYSIYNIAFTNVIMVSFHLLIAPQAGPDTKYLLAFMRTQLSTTVTIALVFGSKLLSVLRGDPKALKDIPTSANGFGHETLDLEEENQQLKEELTKMATQIEKLKSYAMCKNNPHLKHSTMNVNVTTESDNNKLDAYASL